MAKSELMQQELEEAWQIKPELKQLKQQIGEVSSRLELSELDRDIFKEDLDACRSEQMLTSEMSAKQDE